MIKLVIQDDEGKTTIVPMIRDEITVGRTEGNTIRLTERNVSRKHARILQDNGSLVVEDLNSYNGVRVNGSRIQGRVGLNVSDRIQIGDYLIELKADAAVVPVDVFSEETRPVETVPVSMSQPPGQMPAPGQVPAPVMASAVPMPSEDNDATTKMSTPATAMLKAASLSSPDLGASGEHISMAPQPAAGPPARVVILSTSLAGQEFELTRPAMVIGRTEDNDISVDHRSISRHHAKIVCENGRYAIVDLQSSNGVRVNGEEYSKVELRRTDVIDLGHVRFRFVEPGEDFLFGRDAHAVVVPSNGNRKLMYGAIAAVLIGAIAIFAFTRGGGDDGAADDSTEEVKGAPLDGDDTNTAPDKDGAKAKIVQADLEKIQLLLDVARSSIAKKEWDSALNAVNKALDIQSDSSEAKELAEKAEFEKGNQKHYDTFKKAITDDSPVDIAKSFESIDDNSIYKEQARKAHDKKRSSYVKSVTSEAKSLARKNKCGELESLKDAAASAWQEAGEAVGKVECSEQVASKPDKKPDRKPDKKPDKKPEKKKPEKKPTKSFDKLLAESKAAMQKSQYGKARRLCADALKIKSRDPIAATVCGMAACKMKKAKLARKYHSMLPPQRKNIVRQTCLTNGLSDF